MEPFIIQINGMMMTVYPDQDGTFVVFMGGFKFARIYPWEDDCGGTWESGDIHNDYCTLIGHAIEEYEL